MKSTGRGVWQGRAQVLIVDDHPLLRRGLAELIDDQADLACCGQAETAPAALEMALRDRPDLVVIDISLARGDGLDLVKQIRAQDRSIKTLVYSMHDEKIYAERALAAGASGYISKQEPTDTVLRAIRRVLSGHVHVSEAVSSRMLQRMAHKGDDPGGSPVQRLSDREVQVLRLIGEGLSTRQIAGRLGLSVKTIDTYREHLKAKLNLETANELIRYAVIWAVKTD
jgi:DNA-binding NarL/FixJ family response regulator